MTDSRPPIGQTGFSSIGQDPSDPLLQEPRIAPVRPPPSSPPLLRADCSLPLCTCCSLSRMPFPIHLPTEFFLYLPFPQLPNPPDSPVIHPGPTEGCQSRLLQPPPLQGSCPFAPPGPRCRSSFVPAPVSCTPTHSLHSGWELLQASDFSTRPLSLPCTADQR